VVWDVSTAISHRTRVVVCGEALVDLVPTDGELRPHPGGGPFNTARALARLDVPTAYLGRLSTDRYGRLLAERLEEDGVDLAMTSRGEEPTTLALVELDAARVATYRFYVDGTSAPHFTEEMLPTELGSEVAALHLGTLGLLLEPVGTTLTRLARRERRRRALMVDLNIRPGPMADAVRYRNRLFDLMAMSAVVKASDEDLAWFYPGLDPEACANEMIQAGAQLAVITLGADGALATNGRRRVHIPAQPVEVVDTIGAGDAFGAALLAWMVERSLLAIGSTLSENEMRASLEFAAHAAAVTCSRAGADPPWRWEMDEIERGVVLSEA
jgi:fructokinase